MTKSIKFSTIKICFFFRLYENKLNFYFFACLYNLFYIFFISDKSPIYFYANSV